MSERTDDLQRNGLRIIQETELFCFGVDSVLLTGFAAPGIRRGSSVLDLGSGNGILPILLSAKTEDTHFTGIEIQEECASLARRSTELNALTERIRIITGDLKNIDRYTAPSSFDAVVSNPPYVKAGSGRDYANKSLSVSRSEVACTFEDVARAAAFALRGGGSFHLVHRANRMPEIIKTLMEHNLTPRVMCQVHPNAGKNASMFLMTAVKGAGMEMKLLPPLILCGPDGEYTREVKDIYGL
ncbi:MAG: tRNA1(Val) (adenine(37)-N6)-methyltransferase [Lachnospiraceae bacterium]|nr:tRNA1(Val) (adenine(37)-N6)-methyltransferase [Lachnospiraceae bacterium]